MSQEVQYLWMLLHRHVARVRDDERGVSAVEWVIITGLLIALAVGIGVIITGKVTDKANGISL